MSYKRLTKKDKEYGNYVQNKLSALNEPSIAISCYGKIHGTVIDRLAELEDKIENGTLIELPCKVGDIIYEVFYSKYEARILEMKVIQIVIQETIDYRCKTTSRSLYNYGWVKNEDFNKTWF